VTVAVIAGEITLLCRANPPWRNDAAGWIQDLGAVLRLTKPDDYVMDAKGETIFRKRPFFYVLEGVTIERMRNHQIQDTVTEDIVKTHTCVARLHRFPKAAERADETWLRKNFVVDADKIWVAGQKLGQAKPSMTFSTVIPAEYAVVSSEGSVSGTLDGKPIQASQFLDAGSHSLELTKGRGQIAVIWAQAIERGYSIFDRKHWAPSPQGKE
jgi:hypothetical protein